MFKWLRDARYLEVQSEMKILKADIELLNAKLETMKTNMNSIRGMINRKVSKEKFNEPGDEESGGGDDAQGIIQKLIKEGYT